MPSSFLTTIRDRQIIDKFLHNADWPCARAAAAVRRGKCLVQIDMNDIKAEIARPCLADDGVEICAVIIGKAVNTMDKVANFLDVRIKQSQRIWTGQHQACNFVIRAFFQVRSHP